jgi:predicted amidophosphoribosyltransferase
MSVYDRLKLMCAWLLPAACTLCGERVPPETDFCENCAHALPRIASGCARCGIPFEKTTRKPMVCGRCQREPPAYTVVRAPFRYSAPVDRLIQGAKYSGRLDWAALLGRQLARHTQPHAGAIDALVPVPLHRARLRERGYNQAVELTRPLVKHFGIPMMWSVARVRATPPQTTLSRTERRKNMRRAFAADPTTSPACGLLWWMT